MAREAGSVATWKRDDTGEDAPGADSTDPGDTDSDETDPARDDVLRHLRSLGYINWVETAKRQQAWCAASYPVSLRGVGWWIFCVGHRSPR